MKVIPKNNSYKYISKRKVELQFHIKKLYLFNINDRTNTKCIFFKREYCTSK